MPLTVYTIGHSTHPLEDFVEMLRSHGILRLMDVRTIPRSRHNPQFNGENLGPALAEQGIDYRHASDLGGLRHSRTGSANTGWHNLSFRGFADYMQTPEFTAGLADLIERAAEVPTAIMCAEAVPWRCHRSLIADALAVRGIRVVHIIGPKSVKPHALTAMARVDGLTIIYPAGEEAEADDSPES